MGSLGIGHWIIIAIIVIFFFGRSNLGNMGRNIGRGIRGFKEGLNEIDAESRPVDEIADRKEKEKEKKS